MSNFLITSTNTVNQLMIAETLGQTVVFGGIIVVYKITQQQKAPVLKYMLIPSRLNPSHRINKNKSISHNATLHIFYTVHAKISPHGCVSNYSAEWQLFVLSSTRSINQANLRQGCTNSGCQVTQASKICTVAPITCGY